MKLRRGKTNNILLGSIDAALLAVEVYNKPRTTFRSQAYIVLMIIAWTRFFHAYFNKTKGDRYYYKDDNGHYKRVNGDRKAWELSKCLKEYEKCRNLSEALKSNVQFFIGLRNKIEHHNVAERELDALIFGECQSLLFNYENLLIEVFGNEYAINESLAFSLQFSNLRTKEQKQANKKVLSGEIPEIKKYINDYRSGLGVEVLNSLEYWIKLIPTPKISNTKRGDLTVNFVRSNDIDAQGVEELTAIIKDKPIMVEAKNTYGFKAGEVKRQVKNATRVGFNQTHHTWLVAIFSVRPPRKDPNPHCTNADYCIYDTAHKDYVYNESWVNLIVELFEVHRRTIEKIHQAYKDGEKWDIQQFSQTQDSN